MSRVPVLIASHILGILDYRVPYGMTLQAGDFVEVPLGPRRILGCVWDAASDSAAMQRDHVGDNRLREVLHRHDVPPLPADLRRLIEWTADYYFSAPGSVMRMTIPAIALHDAGRPIIEYRQSGNLPPRMTVQRQAALDKIGDMTGSIADLVGLSGVSEAVIRGLVKTGALVPAAPRPPAPPPLPDPDFAPPPLSDAQRAAADALSGSIGAGFQPFVLDGVTGSGKTEVYFEAVAHALRAGKQILLLQPEIALTQPMVQRFAARFGAEPLVWHSALRQSERRSGWHAIADGSARVIIGARSALFLPYANLGLIIVDEAHEGSFKQEDGVHYHARDVAVMRAQFAQIPIVLASATPAIESRAQVDAGRYRALHLPDRFGGAQLPAMHAIDLRRTPPDRGLWIAPPLASAIDARLARGEQSLLYLNRRGFAPLTLCRHCGHRIQCPHCSAWMVEHRLHRRLACHHCGENMAPPARCPECQEEDALVACGPGVERIADEVTARWPTARTAIVTSDTLWNAQRAEEFIENMAGGLIDIVIGTQLVTKGYHFPNLTLVGVVDADLGLEGGDLRANERCFQQIAQVAGRAGRGEKPGEVFVQTRQPQAPVLAALIAGDTEGFYAAESAARKAAGMPPYGRLAAIIIASKDARAAADTAKTIGDAAPAARGVEVWGPAPAPLAMLRSRHRHRLLVQAPRNFPLQAMLRQWLGNVDWPQRVDVRVDIDPYSFV